MRKDKFPEDPDPDYQVGDILAAYTSRTTFKAGEKPRLFKITEICQTYFSAISFTEPSFTIGKIYWGSAWHKDYSEKLTKEKQLKLRLQGLI